MDGWVWVWVWDWVGWDLCAGLFYEHRFAMLIKILNTRTDYARKQIVLWPLHRIFSFPATSVGEPQAAYNGEKVTS